jgi:hypothetical protein
MMALMGKGTRAAGTRRRAAGSAPAPEQYQGQAPQGQGHGQYQGQGQGQAQFQSQGGGQGRQGPPPAEPREYGRPKSGRGATFSVVVMTLIALVGVGVLAAQAEATAPKVRATGTTASSTKSTGTKTGTGSTAVNPTALPANSGSGTRIVYSLGGNRVWLVQSSTVERTMPVVGATIVAPAGSYTVSSKTSGSLGSDNVTVLYVVKFGSSYGFDAEANVSGLPPKPTGQTGGVRMAQLDAYALYQFASVGTKVVVVP